MVSHGSMGQVIHHGKNTSNTLLFNLGDSREEKEKREWLLKTLVHWRNDNWYDRRGDAGKGRRNDIGEQ